MNIAGKGALLILVVVAMGVFALSEGFGDSAGENTSQPVQTTKVDEQTQDQETEEAVDQSTSETTSESQSEGSEESEETSQESSSSTNVLHPPAEVRVLVANGTEVTGAAGATLDTLVATQGYNGVQAVNDTGEEVIVKTYVYYSQGYELDAQNIRLIINGDKDFVLPMPVELPIEDLLDANVLVHVGADLFPGG
jgi:cytoskeletal protein RodZ